MLQPSTKLEGIEISEIRQMNALATATTINLGIGQLPDAVPAEVKAAGIAAFENDQTRYTANQGSAELCKAVAASVTKATGVTTSEKNVIITNGAEGALWNVLFTYLNAGDEVLIPAIGFSVYDTITKMQGATPICYNMGCDFSLDLADIERKISEKTRFIVFNNPGNPTGRVYSDKEIRQLTTLVERYDDLYIISDEIYKDLYFGEIVPQSARSYSDRVIVVDGISKRGAATGLRIGWTVAPEEITAPMIISNQYITTCAACDTDAAQVVMY